MTILKNFIRRLRQDEPIKQKTIPHNIKQNIDPFEIWSDNLTKVGEGAFGFIYKVKRKNSNEIAALKRIQFDSEDELHDLLIEIDILSSIDHQNVVKMNDAYIFDSKIWIFLEFCSHGAVDSIIQHLEKPLNENQIKVITKYTLDALIYLHDNLIIHRDLKAGNILITDSFNVKIVDFGVSARLTSENGRRDSFTGTPYWMAPEVINCETSKEHPYNQMADIWSFGITIIEMAELRPPHQELNPNRVLMRIRKANPPTLSEKSNWSDYMHEFLNNCLQKNPDDRMTSKQLSTLPFVNKVTEEDKYHLKILIAEYGADVEEEFEEISADKIPSTTDESVILSPDAEILLRNVKEDSRILSNSMVIPDQVKSKSPLTLNTSINANHSSGLVLNKSSEDVLGHLKLPGRNASSPPPIHDRRIRIRHENLLKSAPMKTKKFPKNLFHTPIAKKKDEISREVLSQEIGTNLLEDVIMDEHINPSIPGCVFEVMYEINQNQDDTKIPRPSEVIKKTKRKPPLPPSRLVKENSKDLTDKTDQPTATNQITPDNKNKQIIDKGLPLLSSLMNYRFVKRSQSVSLKENLNPRKEFNPSNNKNVQLDNYMKSSLSNSNGSPSSRKWSSFTNLAISSQQEDKNSPSILEKVAALALTSNKFSLRGFNIKKRSSITSLKDSREYSNNPISLSFEDGKSPKNLISSNHSDTSSTTSSVFRRQSTFRTTRRTRRFIVDGKPMVTTSTHIGVGTPHSDLISRANHKKSIDLSQDKVVTKQIDYKNQEFPVICTYDPNLGNTIALRDQALREFRMASKQERKLERELEKNSKAQFEQLEHRMKTSAITLQKEFENNLDQLSKQHKASMEKAEAAHDIDLKKRVQLYKDINKSCSLRGNSLFKYDSFNASNPQISIDDINQQFKLKMSQLNYSHLEAKHALREKFIRDKYALEEQHMKQRHKLTKSKVGDFYLLQRQRLENWFKSEENQLKNIMDMNRENLNAEITQQYRNRSKALKCKAKQRVNKKLRDLRQSKPPLSSQEIKDKLMEFEESEKVLMTSELLNLDRYFHQLRLTQELKIEAARAELSELHRERVSQLHQEECDQMAQLEFELDQDLKSFSNLLPDSHKLVRLQNENERAKQDKIFRMIRNQTVVP